MKQFTNKQFTNKQFLQGKKVNLKQCASTMKSRWNKGLDFSILLTTSVPTRLRIYKGMLVLWWVPLATDSGMDEKSPVLTSKEQQKFT